MTKTEKLEKKLMAQIVQVQIDLENQSYGKLILQTNEVQFCLAAFVLLQSSIRSKKYEDYLFEDAQLGTLVMLFQACASKTSESYKLLNVLESYNTNRKRLAHKMMSSKKLSLSECKAAISTGENVLSELLRLVKAKKNN